jgi:hypothetical protein
MQLIEVMSEKSVEATRRWRAANRERANELARENQKKWRTANPELHRARAKAWKAANKERFDKRHKAWRDANRERLNAQGRAAYFRQKYGLTLDERDAMLAAQGGVCAICEQVEHAKRGWAVDHCHQTGKVRGILCQACNLVLGHAGDDVSILQRMAVYLDHD